MKYAKLKSLMLKKDALALIANLSNGALRKCHKYIRTVCFSDDPPISESKVRNLLDIGDDTIYIELVKHLLEKNISKALESVNAATNSGTDLRYGFIWV
ncbi:MAG: hypothetical protein CM1200mP8_1830 [Chloroflexota bacterium]|nr:MAG: hypothetical protein CM1200mP8_1830 [Chloroflexota bacterium]